MWKSLSRVELLTAIASLRGAVLLFPQAMARAQFVPIHFYSDAEWCYPWVDLLWYPTLENLYSYDFRTG